MRDSKKSSSASFEDAKSENIVSGAIKFSTDYVATKQVYEAVQQWVSDDPNVLLACVRGGGPSQVAVDFRYQADKAYDYTLVYDIPNSQIIKGDNFGADEFRKMFIKYFEKVLGGKYIKGWDYSTSAYIVK